MSCQPRHDLPVVLELHDSWEFRQVGDSLWRAASVPGNVFSDLLDHQLIQDPFVGTNEAKVQWVSEANWEYKTNFTLSKDFLNKEHIELNFEGLDTYAEAYLNDTLILRANNAFRSMQVSAKAFLKEENELKIEFTSPAKAEEIEKSKLSYEIPEGNRVFTRKAQFQYGWDWAPELNVMGIWRPVKIEAWNDLRLRAIDIKKLNASSSKAELILDLEVKGESSKELRYDVFVNDSLYLHEFVINPMTPEFIPIEITEPNLWWPHNLGSPHLYNVKVVVKEGNKILDSISTKYGIRDVELVTQPDSLGESFYFKVNGIPVYAKGANYIPQHSFQNKVLETDYERLLQDVVDANMNMLRVWGGGIYEEDQFYDLCDEKGIMVWQDFMFACAMYPGDEDYLSNVKQEAIDNVRRLNKHPSIALWCGNNENSEGWHRWGWQDGRSEEEKEELWANYLKVFDSILPEIVNRYSDVDYWESSPKFGRGNPQYEFEGDAHDWWVWHDGYPFEHFEKHVPRFMSEFGFQSFPSLDVINLMSNSDSLILNSEAVKNHQKHTRGFELINDYMSRDFPVPVNPKDYIYMSQLVQAYGITKGIEAHRRAKPYNMGTLFWQLNDCWPAISWSSIDYDGQWKALQYKATKSFDNLLISPTYDGENQLEVWIVNDALQAETGILEMRLLDFKGEVLGTDSKPIKVLGNSSQIHATMNLNDLKIDLASVVLQVAFKEQVRYYYFKKPKDLKLPQAEIQISVNKVKNGFEIKLLSPVLQKDVFLSTQENGNFDDNFFNLLPNEPKVIFFQSTAEKLTGPEIISFNNFIR